MKFQASIISALACAASVSGHGHVTAPMSRNYYAHVQGNGGNSDGDGGNPIYQSTPQGINRNNGICGQDQTAPGLDYDLWLDTQGKHMPWISQATWQNGQDVSFDIHLTAHHRGHFIFRGCPLGNLSGQECLDYYPLEFKQDVYFGMPKDPNYPGRYYIKDNQKDYRLVYKLPDDLVGEEVIIQWMYVTANSCNPDGYKQYFNGPGASVSSACNCGLSDCATPEADMYHVPPPNKAGPFPAPEIFYNCIEVTIEGEPTPTPPFPPPAPRPPTDAPVIVLPENLPPVDPSVTGTCGGGNPGNGVCPDHHMCCSKWGHCGTVASGHCNTLAPCTVCGDDYNGPKPLPDQGGGGGGGGGDSSPTPPSGSCVHIPQAELPPGKWETNDVECAKCPEHQWWPCDAGLCKC